MINRHTAIRVLLFAFILLTIPAAAEAKKPKNYREIDTPAMKWEMPDYNIFTLDNGISGLVVEDDEVPLVRFALYFPASPDPEARVGLAEMTAWTLRNGGSVNIPADSLNDIIEYKAAWLGVWAGQELLQIVGFCHKDDLDFLFGLAIELIENPAYPEEMIELKKSTMLEEIRRRYDRPRGIGFREMNKLIYPGHPYGRETSEETVNSISREDLLDYHRKVFNISRSVIGFSGDVTTKQVTALVEGFSSKLQSGSEQIEPLPPAPEPAEQGIYYYRKDVKQAFISMGHQTIDYYDPRRHASEIMNFMLGGGSWTSILKQRIRVNEGLSYAVWSGFSTPVPVIGRFRASASTRLDQAGRTLALMKEVIEDYRQNGPTEEQFERAKDAFVNSYVWKYEDSSDILYRLTYLMWRGLPLDTPTRDLEAYQNLTLEDVKQAARELLHPDKLITVVVGNEEKMDRPLSDFGEMHELNPAEE